MEACFFLGFFFPRHDRFSLGGILSFQLKKYGENIFILNGVARLQLNCAVWRAGESILMNQGLRFVGSDSEISPNIASSLPHGQGGTR